MTLTPPAPLDAPAPTGRRRRRTAAVAGGLAVAAVIGGGAWGYHFWTAQGPQPAEALPSSTLAYVAVDLDPPGGQKVAAYEALRKFPALKKELKLGSSDDLGSSLIDELASEVDCELDADEVQAWAGDRFAFAVVDQESPEPVVVLQVDDADEAKSGLEKAAAACGDDEAGFAVADGWAVLARNDAVAAEVLADAEKGTLADDEEYDDLVGAAGDAGVVTVYAAPEAGRALLDAADDEPFIALMVSPFASVVDPVSSVLSMFALTSSAGFEEDFAEADAYEPTPEEKAINERFEKFDQLSPAEQEQLMKDSQALSEKLYGGDEGDEGDQGDDDFFGDAEVPEEVREALEGFSGAGGIARFDDGSLELEVVGDPMIGGASGFYAGNAGGRNVADLPADTAAAFGAAFAEGWADRVVEGMQRQFLFMDQSEEEIRTAFEDATGLSIPDDLEALGGDSIAVVAGGGFDPNVVEDDPTRLEVAVRITGDADRIEGALDKLRKALPQEAEPWISSRTFQGGVVVGPDEDYLEQVAEPEGDLGGSDRFRQAVPDADQATSVTYVDFDAGDWLADLATSEEERRNLAPLDSAGLSQSEDGDLQHLLLRVTLD